MKSRRRHCSPLPKRPKVCGVGAFEHSNELVRIIDCQEMQPSSRCIRGGKLECAAIAVMQDLTALCIVCSRNTITVVHRYVKFWCLWNFLDTYRIKISHTAHMLINLMARITRRVSGSQQIISGVLEGPRQGP